MMLGNETVTTFGAAGGGGVVRGVPVAVRVWAVLCASYSAERQYADAVAAEVQFQQDVQGQTGGGNQ